MDVVIIVVCVTTFNCVNLIHSYYLLLSNVVNVHTYASFSSKFKKVSRDDMLRFNTVLTKI